MIPGKQNNKIKLREIDRMNDISFINTHYNH